MKQTTIDTENVEAIKNIMAPMAFPVAFEKIKEHHIALGLNKRELFASMAMAALLQNSPLGDVDVDYLDEQNEKTEKEALATMCAMDAVIVADALIEELARVKK